MDSISLYCDIGNSSVRNILYHKNAPQGCAARGKEICPLDTARARRVCKQTLCSYT